MPMLLTKTNRQWRLLNLVLIEWLNKYWICSQGIKQVAAEIEASTGRHVFITDVRLLLFNPVDLRGIPTADKEKTLAIWLKPKIFQMDESEDSVNILFLDEISAAPQSVQAAAYQITLDRTIGEHRLPENCIVIAAGNRVTDRSVAYNMPKALANRLCHLEICEDQAAWHDWAVKKDIHRFVAGYLEYNPTAMMRFEPSGTSLAFPTPRSWEMVSNILNTVSEDLAVSYPLIVGCVGTEAADSFRVWTRLYETIPNVQDIFEGKCDSRPEAAEILTALRSAMVDYARSHFGQAGVDASLEYACNLPWAFRNALMHDYSLIPELGVSLSNNAIYQAAVTNGLK